MIRPVLFLIAAAALGADKEAVLELGSAVSRNLTDRNWSFGPTAAIEFTPIEKWLEIEAGVTPFYNRRPSEWDVDLLFKKPWDLTRKIEFMAGAGPEWIHARTNALAFEAVLDFMFWPSPKRRFGWYIEPGFEYTLGRVHEKSIGISAGLLITLR